MNIDLEVSKASLVFALSRMDRDKLCDLIAEVDLMVAEVDFTEGLVRKLVTSLKSDKEDVRLPFIDWSKVT